MRGEIWVGHMQYLAAEMPIRQSLISLPFDWPPKTKSGKAWHKSLKELKLKWGEFCWIKSGFLLDLIGEYKEKLWLRCHGLLPITSSTTHHPSIWFWFSFLSQFWPDIKVWTWIARISGEILNMSAISFQHHFGQIIYKIRWKGRSMIWIGCIFLNILPRFQLAQYTLYVDKSQSGWTKGYWGRKPRSHLHKWRCSHLSAANIAVT